MRMFFKILLTLIFVPLVAFAAPGDMSPAINVEYVQDYVRNNFRTNNYQQTADNLQGNCDYYTNECNRYGNAYYCELADAYCNGVEHYCNTYQWANCPPGWFKNPSANLNQSVNLKYIMTIIDKLNAYDTHSKETNLATSRPTNDYMANKVLWSDALEKYRNCYRPGYYRSSDNFNCTSCNNLDDGNWDANYEKYYCPEDDNERRVCTSPTNYWCTTPDDCYAYNNIDKHSCIPIGIRNGYYIEFTFDSSISNRELTIELTRGNESSVAGGNRIKIFGNTYCNAVPEGASDCSGRFFGITSYAPYGGGGPQQSSYCTSSNSKKTYKLNDSNSYCSISIRTEPITVGYGGDTNMTRMIFNAPRAYFVGGNVISLYAPGYLDTPNAQNNFLAESFVGLGKDSGVQFVTPPAMENLGITNIQGSDFMRDTFKGSAISSLPHGGNHPTTYESVFMPEIEQIYGSRAFDGTFAEISSNFQTALANHCDMVCPGIYTGLKSTPFSNLHTITSSANNAFNETFVDTFITCAPEFMPKLETIAGDNAFYKTFASTKNPSTTSDSISFRSFFGFLTNANGENILNYTFAGIPAVSLGTYGSSLLPSLTTVTGNNFMKNFASTAAATTGNNGLVGLANLNYVSGNGFMESAGFNFAGDFLLPKLTGQVGDDFMKKTFENTRRNLFRLGALNIAAPTGVNLFQDMFLGHPNDFELQLYYNTILEPGPDLMGLDPAKVKIIRVPFNLVCQYRLHPVWGTAFTAAKIQPLKTDTFTPTTCGPSSAQIIYKYAALPFVSNKICTNDAPAVNCLNGAPYQGTTCTFWNGT